MKYVWNWLGHHFENMAMFCYGCAETAFLAEDDSQLELDLPEDAARKVN